jgi:hypothetical protein
MGSIYLCFPVSVREAVTATTSLKTTQPIQSSYFVREKDHEILAIWIDFHQLLPSCSGGVVTLTLHEVVATLRKMLGTVDM